MDNDNPNRIQYFPLIISILITLAIGISAAIVTRPEIAGWYSTIKKPAFTPADTVFPYAWTILYILIGIAAYLVWKQRDRSTEYKITVAVYIIQLLLNFSWSIVFFRMHDVFGAVIVIKLLWISILCTIVYFGKFSKAAAWLLVPYLLWVSFAAALNLAIFLLNR